MRRTRAVYVIGLLLVAMTAGTATTAYPTRPSRTLPNRLARPA